MVAGHGRRVARIEVVVEPVVVRNPRVAVPVEVTDTQVPVLVAVMCGVPSMPPPFEYSRG